MKKLITLSIAAAFMASATCAFAAPNFAASSKADFGKEGYTVHAKGGPAQDATIGKLSTKVALGWNTSNIGYAINAQHEQGTKAYGSSFDSTSIYMVDVTKGTAVDVPSSTGSDSFSSWQTM